MARRIHLKKFALPQLDWYRRMDWYRGLRAACALCLPQLLSVVTANPYLSWSGLGGFEAIFADSGGPYRIRLETLFTVTFGGALGLTVGTLAGMNVAYALPLTALFCFVWSYLGVLGQPFSSAGNLVLIIYFCGIGAPSGSVHAALTRGLFLIFGGLWAVALSLFLWPLDPYRPARIEASICYSELASFLRSILELAQRERQTPALWHRIARHHQFRIRAAIERAWNSLAAARATRQAETPQGQQLVVLLEHADLLISRTIAIAEALEAHSIRDHEHAQLLFKTLENLRNVEEWVAELLTTRAAQKILKQAITKRNSLPLALDSLLENKHKKKDANLEFLVTQLVQSAAVLDSTLDSATQLRATRTAEHSRKLPVGASTTHFAYVITRLSHFRERWSLTRIMDQMLANLSPSSLLLRHAARVTIVCSLDVVLIFAFHIDHGYWILLTSMIVLQPYISGTMRRGVERIAGTVGGGALAAVLALSLHSQLATTAVLFPLAVLTLAILPVNYTLCAFFLTPTFVLAWMPYSGDWQLALLRTGNTVLGALLSLAAMLFLFPTYERDLVPKFLRASLTADRNYLAQLVENWKRTEKSSSRLLANARRATGLANNSSEESLDRLLAESWPRRPQFAHFLTSFVTYLRRTAQSVTVLSAFDSNIGWKNAPATLQRFELLIARLNWLEQNLTTPESIADWPQSAHELIAAAPIDSHPGERQLLRLERQIEILHRQLKALHAQGGLFLRA